MTIKVIGQTSQRLSEKKEKEKLMSIIFVFLFQMQ